MFFSNLYVRNLLTLKLFFVNIEVGIVFDGNSIGILLHAVRIPSKKARTPLRFQSKGPQTKTQVVLRTRVGLFLFWFTHYSSVRCTYIIYKYIYIYNIIIYTPWKFNTDTNSGRFKVGDLRYQCVK